MMVGKLTALLLFLAGVSCDKEFSFAGVTTRVKGHSGIIAVFKGENETDGVTITFDAIRELSENEDKIRGVETFARLQFNFSDLEEGEYGNSSVNVTKFSFTSDISVDIGNTPVLTSYVYVFTSEGNVTIDGEEVTVTPGVMKFDVMIKDWKFCTKCKVGNKYLDGEFLDFLVSIKGTKSPEKQGGNKNSYDLGDGASVLVPRQVRYDNTTTEDMPGDYPKLISKGANEIFVFRFRSFNRSALYDPLVTLNSNESSAADAEISANGVSVKVKGQSGKMALMKGSATMDIEFDNLQEVKADGIPVKDTAHRFNTFANQHFTFSSAVDVRYPETQLMAKSITFETTLTNKANLKVLLYVFKTDGEFRNGNETVKVQTGSVKFNVEIKNWKFCEASFCQMNEDGAHLDFEIVVKGSAKAKKGNAGSDVGDKYEFGSGTVGLSKMVSIDNAAEAVSMAPGYPMLENKGGKDIFKFRFPKFSHIVQYDPIIYLSEDSPHSAGKACVPMVSLVTVPFALSILLAKLI